MDWIRWWVVLGLAVGGYCFILNIVTMASNAGPPTVLEAIFFLALLGFSILFSKLDELIKVVREKR